MVSRRELLRQLDTMIIDEELYVIDRLSTFREEVADDEPLARVLSELIADSVRHKDKLQHIRDHIVAGSKEAEF